MNEEDHPAALLGFPVVVRLPIQWGDLDAYGHVNNLVYLKWFEAARALYATKVGVEVLPGKRGVGALLASISCKYLRELTYPGEVYSGVRATRLSLGGVSLEFRIVDCRLGDPVAEGSCDVVLIDYSSSQPIAVPDEIRAAVEQLEGKRFSSSRT